jgi:hypothetical protein
MALFQKGHQLSKGKGRPPSLHSTAEPGTRMKYLVKEYGTDVILRAMNDQKFLAQTFSAYDAMLIAGIGNSIKGSGEERERVLNRMFGKVPDKQINLNLNIDVRPEQLTSKANEMLARIAADDDE